MIILDEMLQMGQQKCNIINLNYALQWYLIYCVKKPWTISIYIIHDYEYKQTLK